MTNFRTNFLDKLEQIAFVPDSRVKTEEKQAAMIALSVYYALDKNLEILSTVLTKEVKDHLYVLRNPL